MPIGVFCVSVGIGLLVDAADRADDLDVDADLFEVGLDDLARLLESGRHRCECGCGLDRQREPGLGHQLLGLVEVRLVRICVVVGDLSNDSGPSSTVCSSARRGRRSGNTREGRRAGQWDLAVSVGGPMSDVDVVVPPALRAQATAALVAAGFTFDSASPHEDTFLAWGDGSVGRTDGESVDHNGRVEVHPGWNEFIHGYVVDGLSIDADSSVRPLNGASCARLDLTAVTASVIGHLSSTVVRCEVRALNVVDVLFCHMAGVEWAAVAGLLDECDPRLTGPGLWLVANLVPEVVPASIVEHQVARLPRAARHRLGGSRPEATLRDPSARTTLGWRQAFTMRLGERVAVLRQMAQSTRLRQ